MGHLSLEFTNNHVGAQGPGPAHGRVSQRAILSWLDVGCFALTLGVSLFDSFWAIVFQGVGAARDLQESFVTLVRRGPALRTALCELIPRTFAFFAGD